MGVLTDFVIANRNEVQEVCEAICTSPRFPRFDAKGINTFMLDNLHSILTGEDSPPLSDEPLYDGGEDGPWVFEVPHGLVERLAELEPHQILSTAIEWFATEEFTSMSDGWSPEAVEVVLSKLAALSRQALEKDKSVLMWICL